MTTTKNMETSTKTPPTSRQFCNCTRRTKRIVVVVMALITTSLIAFLLWWFLSSGENAAAQTSPTQEQWGQVTISTAARTAAGSYASTIESYWATWLTRDEEKLKTFFDAQNFVLINQNTGRRVEILDETSIVWQEEWAAYEGTENLIALKLRVLDLMVLHDDDNAILVTYWLEVIGGSRWAFDDSAFVTQVFRKDKNKVVFLADSWGLDYDPTLEQQVRTEGLFLFDFVYPVTNMTRAASFYDPILGPAEVEASTKRIYDMQGHRFILDTSVLDGFAIVEQDLPSGYVVFTVDDIEERYLKIQNEGTGGNVLTDIKTNNAGDKYFVATDPGGNVFVVQEILVTVDDTSPSPNLTIDASSSSLVDKTTGLLRAWLEASSTSLAEYLGDNTVWFDDGSTNSRLYGTVIGSDAILTSLRENFWETFDRNPSTGLSIDMTISGIKEQSVNNSIEIVSFKCTMVGTGNHPFRRVAWVTHIYDASHNLILSISVRSKLNSDTSVRPFAASLDYTGYPTLELEPTRQFYRTSMGLISEYQDTDWYGWWGINSVFGIYRSWPCDGIPRREKTNGYASLWVSNAQDIHEYLQAQGATFPLITAINNAPGMEQQPGYSQVVSSDSEGNVILFSEYPAIHGGGGSSVGAPMSSPVSFPVSSPVASPVNSPVAPVGIPSGGVDNG